jgi:hypothetical protein
VKSGKQEMPEVRYKENKQDEADNKKSGKLRFGGDS